MLKIADKVEGEISNGSWRAGAEIGDMGFNPNNKHVGWEQVTTRMHSGERSYWSQNNSRTCSALTSQSLELAADEPSTLEFWITYDLDFQFDGGVVEITQFADVWESVDMSPDYPSQFRTGNDSCGYEAGVKAFTGSDLSWKKHSVDLSQYQGQSINIRWNYSSDVVNNGEGWFVDDISVSNVQVHSQCETVVAPQIQPGLWYDSSRNGHGFAVEALGFNDLYFTIFYSYKDDGTPEWFTSLSTLENGILNINLEDDTLQRFNYDYAISPVGAGAPNILDESIGTNVLSINFNSDTVNSSAACTDGIIRSGNTALATWQLGTQQDEWCLAALIAEPDYPSPDFGGTWWTGIDDTGWGFTLAFANDTIVAIVYYYDAEGNPRWVLGQKQGFTVGTEITFDLLEFHGFPRDAQPVATSNEVAGTVSLTINSINQNLNTDGNISIDVTYKGLEGGTWNRTNMPITNFTQEY